jgi:hypothetical protein
VVAAALLLVPIGAGAQNYCQDFTDVLLDTSYNCVSTPSRERAFGVEVFSWGSNEYLMINRGNELEVNTIGGPYKHHPYRVSGIDFYPIYGTAGDSDYDIMSFDICDGCRFGVIDHKVGNTLVFDLGSGGQPSFGAHSSNGVFSVGSMVFKAGSQHYLIASRMGDCSGSGLYAIDSVNDLEFLQCLEADGSPFGVKYGQSYATGTGTYIYVGTGILSDITHVFAASGSGHDLRLQHVATPAGMITYRYGLAIDPNHQLAASADFRNQRLTFWDLANPGQPVLKTAWTIEGAVAGSVSMASATTGSPIMLWTGALGFRNSTRTYRVDPDTGPEATDNEYWTDLTEPHNAFQTCVLDQGGALSPDGSALYVSRYALHQVFDLTECMGPTPAVADVAVSPVSVFPGGTVTLNDNSVGSYDRWALWVEKNGIFEAGSQTPSAGNPQQMSYTIPVSLPAGDVLEANIALESDELDPLAASDSTPIGVNRAPQASFTITPDGAVVGDTVTLTASAAASPTGFRWTIDPPGAAPYTASGQTLQVPLGAAGNWAFHLTVDYAHGATGGADPDGDGLYEATASVTDYGVSSVAASFTIAPPTPYSTQQITLDGTSSKGNISSWSWTVYGPTDRGSDGIPPGFYNGCGSSATCTIPGGSLEWGAWNVTLTVANPGGDSDDATASMVVADGSFQPTIEWTPSAPEIGESVTFSIRDLVGTLTRATWDFGEQGCEGANAIQVCEPALFDDCKSIVFRFANGGSKEVTVTVETDDGMESSSEAHTINVQYVGSCVGSWQCGNAGYDNGQAGGAASFGGGMAGSTDHLFAVKIELADFGRSAGRVALEGFCAADQINATYYGGPWPNEIFVYPDVGGEPNEEVLLAHGTVVTGDGSGISEVTLSQPVVLDGDFWLINRGDVAWTGEDFHMEYDTTPNSGHSFVSSAGIAGLAPGSHGNYMLRATLANDTERLFAIGYESATLGGWSAVASD